MCSLFSPEHKFASAGREDVDVRMLGSGKLAVHTCCGRIRKAILFSLVWVNCLFVLK